MLNNGNISESKSVPNDEQEGNSCYTTSVSFSLLPFSISSLYVRSCHSHVLLTPKTRNMLKRKKEASEVWWKPYLAICTMRSPPHSSSFITPWARRITDTRGNARRLPRWCGCSRRGKARTHTRRGGSSHPSHPCPRSRLGKSAEGTEISAPGSSSPWSRSMMPQARPCSRPRPSPPPGSLLPSHCHLFRLHSRRVYSSQLQMTG